MDEIPDLTIYEIARRNMVAFSEHYIKKENMSKNEWFNIQKDVLDKFSKEMKKKERKRKNET